MSELLPVASAEEAGLRPDSLRWLEGYIQGHIDAGLYSGAQIAMARHGKLAFVRSFGQAAANLPTADSTPFLLYSNTKVLTATLVCALAERGLLTFSDRVADYVPEFARHGKQDITIMHLLTHQAGFPNAHGYVDIPVEAYRDHKVLREVVADFTLQWAPGSRVEYHHNAAHWTMAVVIESITGKDFRQVKRETVFEPLDLHDELLMGVPDELASKVAAMLAPGPDGKLIPHADDNPDRRRAGVPAGGAFGSARAMAVFYQALLNGGANGKRRVLGRKSVEFMLRDTTGGRVIQPFGQPRAFGFGPWRHANSLLGSGFGPIASPNTFGHLGGNSSCCWADPDTGVSFAYTSNTRIDTPWDTRRWDVLGQMAHAAII
jgi:CubicO group peptidase (beta-lactamase class C family)